VQFQQLNPPSPFVIQITNQTNRRFSTLMGPLGAREAGWYPDMPFSLKCFVAVDVFGRFVREPQHLDSLAKMPTMIVQTEIDDSADHNVGVQIVEEIRRRGGMHKFSTMLQLSPN
jgi:hypothetical protein